MSAQTVRTTIHQYPLEEIRAMEDFYGGCRCVISNSESALAVQWCHIIDTALTSSNDQLSEMLRRNLREDRHPRHAGEVRENIVPTSGRPPPSPYGRLPPTSTLFLHEDIVARTLAYEQDLQAWRCAELSAGRPDPGRPAYGDVFDLNETNPHRYHLGGRNAFLREDGDDFIRYNTSDCPGIDDPTAARHFPVIPTLLSIPFSLLHTTPRLAALLPLSTHQTELLAMAVEIIRLWWWDPSPQMLEQRRITQSLNIAADRQNNGQSAKPPPIHDPLRTTTTFATKRPTITFGAHVTNFPRNLNRGKDAVQRGPVILALQDHWLLDGTLPTVMDGELLKENIDIIAITGVIGPSVSSEAETEDQNVIDSLATSEAETEHEKVISDSTIGDKSTSSIDIGLWAAKVIHAEPVPQPLPLTLAPFERGVIASMPVNDILMVKGFINPVVYVDFF